MTAQQLTHLQLIGPMYDIDLFDNDAATVSALHEDGRIVI